MFAGCSLKQAQRKKRPKTGVILRGGEIILPLPIRLILAVRISFEWGCFWVVSDIGCIVFLGY